MKDVMLWRGLTSFFDASVYYVWESGWYRTGAHTWFFLHWLSRIANL